MRCDTPLRFRILGTIVVVLSALAVGACQPEISPFEAAEPLAGEQVAEESLGSGGNAAGSRGRAVSVTPDDEAYLGSFGLLAPAMPGLALGAYASSCNPIDDPFESCL